VRHLLGISLPASEGFFETAWQTAVHLPQSNPATVALGLGALALLLTFRHWLPQLLHARGVSVAVATAVGRAAPLLVVLAGTLLVWGFRLNESAGVGIVGDVPAGLPPLSLPLLDLGLWQTLLPAALAISLVGFTESISVAKALASKRRQKVDANQELVALGIANLGATFSGGYPVTAGISRSMVNFSAGANTGLASLITAVLVALTLIFLMPLFTYLPQAVLAAVIVAAILGLVDVGTLRYVWRYNKADAASLLLTFAAVLLISVEIGVAVGVVASLLLYLWRTSKPHVAVVGRLGDSETYRNVLRHPVRTCAHVTAVRVDESLYFANTRFLEETMLDLVSRQPELRHLVLICSAVNTIDASALETLESLARELKDAGVAFYLTDVKGPVMDRLERVGFVARIGPKRIFLSVHDAMRALDCA
jgi:sulfate permease, SulP family